MDLIGLPSFDGLNGNVSGQSRILCLILSRMLLEKSHRVHIVVDGKIVKTGDASLAQEIEVNGYSQYK